MKTMYILSLLSMGAQAGNTDEMEQAEGVFCVGTDPKFTSIR